VPNQLDNLSFAVFRVTLRVSTVEPVILPPFSGSALHGALGWALGRVVYGSGPRCPDCSTRSQCRYGSLFDYLFKSPADHPLIAPNYEILRETYGNRELNNLREFPPPYIIDPPYGGRYDQDENIVFNLVLVGRAIEFFPFFLCALENLSDKWLGDNRKAGVVLEDITAVDCAIPGTGIPIYDPFTKTIDGAGLIFDYFLISRLAAAQSPQISAAGNRLEISFLTPLKFRKRGKISSDLGFSDLFRLILRRIVLLSVHSPLLERIDQVALLEQAKSFELVHSDFDFGSVARGKKNLFACMGKIVFTSNGDITPLLPGLRLGEWLHVGKAVTLGFGKYRVDFPDNNP